jgi:uncharacterized protein (DUF2249 family)
VAQVVEPARLAVALAGGIDQGQVARLPGWRKRSSSATAMASAKPMPTKPPVATVSPLDDDEALELLVDIDPWPLRSYLDATRNPSFTWEVIENGPDTWRVRLRRASTAPA